MNHHQVLAVLLILSMIVTGCASGGAEPSPSAVPSTSPPTLAAAPTDTPIPPSPTPLLPSATPLPSTPTPGPQPADDAGGRILFIGNSHTFMNDLPGMFAALARSAGREVAVDSSARGGYTLEQHAQDRQTQEKLEGGGWDFVVLQESTQVLTVESTRNAQMAPAVGALEETAHSQGAQTVLVLMWASTRAVDEAGLAQFASQQAEVTAALEQMIQGLDVLLAPVGPAWERSLRQRPELRLWGSDNHHASPAGTYLMACVLYATLYRQSPVGLSFTAGLPEKTAQFLQEIAERATDPSTALPMSEGPPTIASLHDTWTRPIDEMVMIYVPGGTFQMGSDTSDSNADDDEFPQHAVSLDGFWMDRTEVTNAQYALCAADSDCKVPPYADDAGFNGDNYPVVGVSWEDAADYCAWAGARLPTEAEWEYAARGTRGSIYPWGDDFDCSRGNFDDETEMDDYVGPGGEGCDGYVRTSPAGSFLTGASWCGALDMAGNVWEWVADWDGDYPSEAQINPTGPTSGNRKILRGGSFNYGPSYIRTADRSRHHPDGRSARGGYVGFRCVGAAPRE